MLRSRTFRILIIACVALLVGAAVLIERPRLTSQFEPPEISSGKPAPSRASLKPEITARWSEPEETSQGDAKPLVYPGKHYLPEVIAQASSLNAPASNADEDISTWLNLLEIYRRVNKGNPTGLNHEIVLQLKGDNGKQFAVLPHDFPGLNSEGEATDRWGTPYFFHTVSDEWMEIRSAGPDRKFWNDDDISTPTMPVKASPAAFARAVSE